VTNLKGGKLQAGKRFVGKLTDTVTNSPTEKELTADASPTSAIRLRKWRFFGVFIL